MESTRKYKAVLRLKVELPGRTKYFVTFYHGEEELFTSVFEFSKDIEDAEEQLDLVVKAALKKLRENGYKPEKREKVWVEE